MSQTRCECVVVPVVTGFDVCLGKRFSRTEYNQPSIFLSVVDANPRVRVDNFR
jgi:hypothetical protein